MFQVKDKLAWNEHAHFHPSGNTTPSDEDIVLTKQLVECGKIIGIEVLDHVIVGAVGGGYVSLKEQGEMWFTDWEALRNYYYQKNRWANSIYFLSWVASAK